MTRFEPNGLTVIGTGDDYTREFALNKDGDLIVRFINYDDNGEPYPEDEWCLNWDYGTTAEIVKLFKATLVAKMEVRDDDA